MKKKTSIHDIARQLNVSATAVSFVLNGKAEEKRISEELKNRILEYVEKVGFSPNLVAKSLRTGRTNIIGMLVEDISDPFFATIARLIEAKAYDYGYKIFFSSTKNETEKAKDLIRIFRERQVDGYIIAPPPGIEKEIQSLLDDGFPVIVFDRYFPGLPTINVVIDNFQGAYNAAEHLIANGFQHIGLVTLESQQTQMSDRLKGYQQAIKARKLKECILRIPYNSSRETITENIKAFLQKHKELNGLLVSTNYLAIGALEAIAALGLTIPEDIAFVGFDDNTHFSLFSTPVTAVAQPLKELSEEVIRQLLNSLSKSNKEVKEQTIVLPTSLIVRHSSTHRKEQKTTRVPGRKKSSKPITQS